MKLNLTKLDPLSLKPNLRRLRLLSYYLKSVPEEHFNLSIWVSVGDGRLVNGQLKVIAKNTSACAIGWATQIPEFIKEGFRLSHVEINKIFISNISPTYQNERGFTAVENFFGLTLDESLNLFNARHYNYSSFFNGHHYDKTLVKTVARRIDKFIANKE